MKLVADTHFHTVASGHAYSTVQEVAAQAAEKGLELIAMTDHAHGMPGGAHRFHFINLYSIPDELSGVRILKGCESNIMDYDGRLDLKDRYLERLEIVIASLHHASIRPGTLEENTNAMIRAIENPLVNVIGHPGNPKFPVDFEKIIKAAKRHNKLVEINNGSFTSRKGCEVNCTRVAQLAKEHGVKVTTGSDAHFSYKIGELDIVKEIFDKVGMPEELVVTTSKEKVLEHLRMHGRKV